MIQSTTANQSKLETITSDKNPLLREVRKALVRGEVTPDGYCAVESFHLLEEAIRSDRRLKLVIAAESVAEAVLTHVKGLKRVRVARLPDALFQSLATTETAQGVIALVQAPRWTIEQLFRGRSLVVVLDAVQDPGNAGTIVRTAEAFGATGVMFLKGTVSPFNSKTTRAAAGSLFRLPFMAGLSYDVARAALEQRRLDVYAAMPAGKKKLSDVDLSRPFALVVGSEGHGVSDKLRGAALDVRIPTVGVESLNAAMAAGVFLYEAARQRVLKS
jgi:TrmH family RNA methyltransferase